MRRNKRILKKIFLILFVVFSSSTIIAGRANAVERASYEYKAIGYGLFQCYADSGFTLDQTVNLSNVNSFNDIVKKKGKDVFLTSLNKSGKKEKEECRKLLQEYTGVKSGSAVLTDEQKSDILTKIGYEPKTSDCISLVYGYSHIDGEGTSYGTSATENAETASICSSNSSVFDEKTISIVGSNGYSYKENGVAKWEEGGAIRVGFIDNNNNAYSGISLYFPEGVYNDMMAGGKSLDYHYEMIDSFSDFKKQLQNDLPTMFKSLCVENVTNCMIPDNVNQTEYHLTVHNLVGGITTIVFIPSTMVRAPKISSSFTLDSGKTRASLRLINGMYPESKLSWDTSNRTIKKDGFKFSEYEKVGLYNYYLLNTYGMNTSGCKSAFDNDEEWNNYVYALNTKHGSNGGVTKVALDGSVTECYLLATKNENQTVYGLNSENIFDGTELHFKDIVEGADVSKIPNFDPKKMDEVVTEIDEGDNETYGTGGPCWNSGIDSMAWVMCPVETNLKNTAKGIGNLIDGWITTDSSFYNNDSPTRIVWEYMRTIANTIMIIILIAIIFSQLTGYGIDNYGIKKMLPKLILMAVLINLSFLICQLAIDLSNIIGNGIQNLFYAIGNSAAGDASTLESNLSDFIGRVVTVIYALAGSGATVVSFAGAVASGGSAMAVVLVLLLLLVIVVALIVVLITIGARTMIAVMCAALSPIAFALYILPNTKPIFKKWADAFKASLVVYPICGAALGFSYIFKVIVVSGTTEFNLPVFVMAAVAPYLPFFIIPSLLKGAISAIGTIGTAISSMGSSLRSTVGKGVDTTSSAVKNSAAYKSGVRDHNTWKAGYKRNKDGTYTKRNLNGFQRFIRGGSIGMTSAKASMIRDEEQRQLENNLNDSLVQTRLAEAGAKQQDANAKAYESYLMAGKVEGINPDDANSLGNHYGSLLRQYHNSSSETEKAELMSKIRGTQNILAQSKPGRERVQSEMEAAVAGKYESALTGGQGAAHYYRQAAGASLNKNRTMDEMVTDLSSGKDMDAIARSANSHYTHEALSKYDASSFSSADSTELRRYADAVATMSDADRATLKGLIDEARSSTSINVSGQTEKIFEDIYRNAGWASAPTVNASVGNNGTAREGEIVRVDQLTNSGILLNPSGDTVRQLKQNADKNMPNGGRIK